MAPSSRTPANDTAIRRRQETLSSGAAYDEEKDSKEEGHRILQAMSDRLETGLNRAALSAIQDLLEAGCHPDAVVAVVMSLSQR